MKTIKTLQYIAVALVALIFIEGLITFGGALVLENYDTMAWVIQSVVVSATVLTAIRVANEGEQ
jgi:hypothetical protein